MTPEEAMERQVKALEKIATALEEWTEERNAAPRRGTMKVETTGTPAVAKLTHYNQQPQQAETSNDKVTRKRPRSAARS